MLAPNASAPRENRIWAQSLRGKAIDMVRPSIDTVHFREIADTMAHITRYAGSCRAPVSVAQHTLIALEAARRANETPQLQAMVLLHDAHEGHGIGDITTPTAQALAEIMAELSGHSGARVMAKMALSTLKKRHDEVIFAAAGLPMPNLGQRAAIKHYDIVALMTERRDFLGPKPENWDPELEAVPPLPRKQKWLPPGEAAAQLWRAMNTLLPALRDGSGRAGQKGAA